MTRTRQEDDDMGRSKKRQEKVKTKPFLLVLVSRLVNVFVFRLGLPICLLPSSLAFVLVLRGPLRYLCFSSLSRLSLLPLSRLSLFPLSRLSLFYRGDFPIPFKIVSKSLTLSQYLLCR
jgi:hypothetical protein